MSFDRTAPARKPDRFQAGEHALEELATLIDDVLVGHVSYQREGQTMVMPTAVAFDRPDGLLMHGSTGAGWMRALADGRPVAVGLTALDALVVARSAFESSMRYRSAVVFGRCEVLEGEAKVRALDQITDTLIPGRTAEVRASTAKELAATLVLRLAIEDVTVKSNSHAWPDDEDDDVAGPAWAGILPRHTTYGAPYDALDLRPGIPLPPSVAALADPAPRTD